MSSKSYFSCYLLLRNKLPQDESHTSDPFPGSTESVARASPSSAIPGPPAAFHMWHRKGTLDGLTEPLPAGPHGPVSSELAAGF